MVVERGVGVLYPYYNYYKIVRDSYYTYNPKNQDCVETGAINITQLSTTKATSKFKNK